MLPSPLDFGGSKARAHASTKSNFSAATPVLPSTEVQHGSGETRSTLRGGAPNPRLPQRDRAHTAPNSTSKTPLLWPEGPMYTQVPEKPTGTRRGRGDGAGYGDPRTRPGPQLYDLPGNREGIAVGLWAPSPGVSSPWPAYTTEQNRPDPPNGSILGLRPRVTSPGPPRRRFGGAGPRHDAQMTGPRIEGLAEATPAAGRASHRGSYPPESPRSFLGLMDTREGHAIGTRPGALGGAGAGAGAELTPKFCNKLQSRMLCIFTCFRFLASPIPRTTLSQNCYGPFNYRRCRRPPKSELTPLPPTSLLTSYPAPAQYARGRTGPVNFPPKITVSPRGGCCAFFHFFGFWVLSRPCTIPHGLLKKKSPKIQI